VHGVKDDFPVTIDDKRMGALRLEQLLPQE